VFATAVPKATQEEAPSWYLDPLVAAQKREVHQNWIRAAVGRRPDATVLKTDLFEEANGEDRIFHDLFPNMRLGVGLDINARTVTNAVRHGRGAFEGMTCDVRRLALPDESVDVVISTSTLDHFDDKQEIVLSLQEMGRVVRPGGIMIVTLDNPGNPFYYILKWITQRGWTPFSLGATLSMAELEEILIEQGFVVEKTGYLIHNPRLLSTGLFVALRRLLRRHADAPIRMLLHAFSSLGSLPSRCLTGCFVAVSAVKPACVELVTASDATVAAHEAEPSYV